MAENTEHQKLSEIFNHALELSESERGEFLDEVCKSNPKLRERIESLLKSYKDNEDFIETPVINSAQFRPILERETVEFENAKNQTFNDKNPRSSILNPKSLRGDLDNIILMALRKESERRYASVEDLSKDISNYLTGLPVSARPNTFFYRASKFYQRNKTASIVGVFLVLSLIFGIIATTRQSVIANQQRDRAEKRFQDVRQLSNSLLFEITPKIERLQGSTEAREVLVKRALQYLDSLAADSSNDLTLQSELASAYEKIGELQGNSSRPNLGDFTGAGESLLKANRIRQNLPQTIENLSLLAENFRILSDIRFEQSETEQALNDTETAIKIYRELVEQNPDSKQLQTSYVKTLIGLAQLYQYTWKLDKSIEVSKQIRQEIYKLTPAEKETEEIVATNFTDMGFSLSWNEQQTEAETEMVKAVEIAESLAIKYPNDAKTQRVVWRTFLLTSAIYETIKDDLSLKFANRALDAAIIASQSDSADFQAKHNLVRSYYRSGICLSNLRRFSEAISALQTAERILNELLEREPRNKVYQAELARIYNAFGETNVKRNNLEEALKAFQKSLDVRRKIVEADANNTNALRDVAVVQKNIGDIQIKLGENEQARTSYEQAIGILTQLKDNNTISEIDSKLLNELINEKAEFRK